MPRNARCCPEATHMRPCHALPAYRAAGYALGVLISITTPKQMALSNAAPTAQLPSLLCPTPGSRHTCCTGARLQLSESKTMPQSCMQANAAATIAHISAFLGTACCSCAVYGDAAPARAAGEPPEHALPAHVCQGGPYILCDNGGAGWRLAFANSPPDTVLVC